jgi:hypothetical protein
MPNEIHRKALVSEAALDWGVSAAELNALPAGDIAWCKPVTTLEDCDYAEVTMAVKVGTTSPEGTLEYYVARDTGTLMVADHHITLTDHGNEGVAADITDIIADCGHPVWVVPCTSAVASIVYTHSFRIWWPEDSFVVFCYNNTDEALAASGHSGYVRGYGLEVQ